MLANQLIKHGANVNAVTRPEGETPLHNACCGGVVTNLDFVELLLKKGADPNFQDHLGLTPLMHTVRSVSDAAKFLLNWSAADANITTQSGGSFLARFRVAVKYFRSDNPEKVEHHCCSGSGLKLKTCWWKGEPSIPVLHPLSSGGVRLRIGHLRD
jgi:hypothetical protein